jgi:hypothetical protein
LEVALAADGTLAKRDEVDEGRGNTNNDIPPFPLTFKKLPLLIKA